MSKASEYVRINKENNRPIFWVHREGKVNSEIIAWVSDGGNYERKSDTNLSPDEAIDLAHWIIDTFGEKE